ncbi:MAG TPA: formate dehydrogenase accessory sulfurtransferase FdhD [Bryobacteraceae bacterium]|nr:formate dehydrogenase accessory sulfurtransferase FdhD [Bryobacteraceae bacterium]
MKSGILTVPVRRFGNAPDSVSGDQDLLAVEEPLQIRLGERNVAITMRTPGHDPELAAGFLFTEGILRSKPEIEGIECGPNTVTVKLARGTDPDPARLERNFYMTSSCGVCGKASIEMLESAGCTIMPAGIPEVNQSVIRSLPLKLREAQKVFERTGGLHAAGLFSAQGELLALREDVGRHNAVDKLIGRAFLDELLPLSDRVLLVSGRASFELTQKAAMAGIPVLAAVSAPSSLAVKTALRFGMTLIGFLRGERFNVYSGASRIVS